MAGIKINIPEIDPHAYKGDVAITQGSPEIPKVHPSGLAEVVGWMARDLATIAILRQNGGEPEHIARLQLKVDVRANVLNSVLPLPDEDAGWRDVASKLHIQEARQAAQVAIDETLSRQ